MSLSSLSSSGTLSPEDLSLTLSGSNLHAFTYAELRAATGTFSRANYLGSGGFGPVYKGVVGASLRPGLAAQAVAVKYLDLDCGTQGHNEWLVSANAFRQHDQILAASSHIRIYEWLTLCMVVFL
jgi:hypothetical protein